MAVRLDRKLAAYLNEGLVGPAPAFYDLDSFDGIDMDHLRVAFMLISPTYACVESLSGSAANKAKQFNQLFSGANLPVDSELKPRLKLIQETHKEYGPFNMPLGDWYLTKGRHIFDNFANRRDVKFLGVTKHEGEQNLSDLVVLDNALNFITSIANDKDWPQTMLLAIPFDLPKDVAIKHVNILLVAYYDWVLKIKDVEYRKRKPLVGKRERPDALVRKLKAMICKALHPDMPLWKIGLLSNVSPAHQRRYVVKGLSEAERNEMRPEIATLTSRAIRQGMYLAEHAAMDKFPLLEKISLPDYDWSSVRDRLKVMYPYLSINDDLERFHP